MALRDKGVIKRAIVTPDKHFPLHDVKSINVLCKTIEIVKPDIYVDLGDVGEWSAFSAWKYKRKKAPPLEFLIEDFDKDVRDVNSGMDIIDESLDKVNLIIFFSLHKLTHLLNRLWNSSSSSLKRASPYLSDELPILISSPTLLSISLNIGRVLELI